MVAFAIVQLNVDAYAQQQSMPEWFLHAYQQQKLDQKYILQAYIKPGFLEADFNGDGMKDIAALVVKKGGKEKGLLIMHAVTLKYIVFGAGIDNPNGGRDFKWLDKWMLYKDKEAGETLFAKDGDITGWKTHKLKRTAIIVWGVEDGFEYSGGIYYWDGKKYIWLQQGE